MPTNPGNRGDESFSNTWLPLPYRPKFPSDRGSRFLRCATVGCTQLVVVDATEEFIRRFSVRVRCPKCGRIVQKREGELALSLVEGEGE